MGLARCSFTCLISSFTSERTEMLYSALCSYQQHLRQKERHCQRSSFSLFVPSWFLRKLTWLQVTSMVLHGGIAAKTTSVLLTKHSWTVSCLRLRAPHHCGDQVPFRTIGPTSADFSNHLALNVFGKWTNMVHFPSRGNPLVYVPPIKAAITKPGFMWTLLIGGTRGPSKQCMSSAFLVRTTRGMLIRESQKTYQRNHERPLALVIDV